MTRDDAPAIAITTSSGSTMDTIHRFLLLPSHVPLILLLEFLNSFRSFGMRFILYNYLTNEFVDVPTNANISDSHAGYILGIKSLLDIAFGLLGSIFVDIYGVRRVSLVALCVALVGRTLLALARSTNTLYLALYLFSPCGDALLSVGLYRVALKKLSTPLTRPLAFALSSSVSNMAGVCVALVVDSMRRNLEDVHVDLSGRGGDFWNWMDGIVGGVYTPVRQFIVSVDDCWMLSFFCSMHFVSVVMHSSSS
jgi:MFS family permease